MNDNELKQVFFKMDFLNKKFESVWDINMELELNEEFESIYYPLNPVQLYNKTSNNGNIYFITDIPYIINKIPFDEVEELLKVQIKDEHHAVLLDPIDCTMLFRSYTELREYVLDEILIMIPLKKALEGIFEQVQHDPAEFVNYINKAYERACNMEE